MKKHPILIVLAVLLIASFACLSSVESTSVTDVKVNETAEEISEEAAEPTDIPPTEEKAPEPTKTQKPSPTPKPQLEIRTGREYLQYDYFHVLGEVVNPSDNWLDFVEIVATFYDADGNMLGTDFTYIILDELPPQDVGVFKLMSDVGGEAANVASYDLLVDADVTTPPYTDLNVIVAREYEEYDYYHIVGQVENTGEYDCEFVQIVVGFYDADGKVVAADYTFTSVDIVPAGGKAPFEFASDVPDFDHYKIWVDGSPVSD